MSRFEDRPVPGTRFEFMKQYEDKTSPRGVPMDGCLAFLSGWDIRANPHVDDTVAARAWLADWHFMHAYDFAHHVYEGNPPNGQTPEQVAAERDLLRMSQTALLARVRKLEEAQRNARENRGKEVARLQTTIDNLWQELESVKAASRHVYRDDNGESPF